MTQNNFPTEFIELPSKGHFYPEDNPLSSGKVEMKYMTAKEEDILTSVNLIQQGVVLDKLLETLIVDKSINLDDILIGDKNAIIVGARILAYGKDYEFNYIDSLGEKVKGKIDLTKLKETKVDLSKFEKGQKVSWVKKMAIVPHPEGKTDRHGNVLPVFRDKIMTGTIMGPCSKGYTVRPDGDHKLPQGMDRYYDVTVEESKLSLV